MLGMPFSHSCSSLAGEISVLGAGVTLDVIGVPGSMARGRQALKLNSLVRMDAVWGGRLQRALGFCSGVISSK